VPFGDFGQQRFVRHAEFLLFLQKNQYDSRNDKRGGKQKKQRLFDGGSGFFADRSFEILHPVSVVAAPHFVEKRQNKQDDAGGDQNGSEGRGIFPEVSLYVFHFPAFPFFRSRRAKQVECEKAGPFRSFTAAVDAARAFVVLRDTACLESKFV
jgi:hypothetical protein